MSKATTPRPILNALKDCKLRLNEGRLEAAIDSLLDAMCEGYGIQLSVTTHWAGADDVLVTDTETEGK